MGKRKRQSKRLISDMAEFTCFHSCASQHSASLPCRHCSKDQRRLKPTHWQLLSLTRVHFLYLLCIISRPYYILLLTPNNYPPPIYLIGILKCYHHFIYCCKKGRIIKQQNCLLNKWKVLLLLFWKNAKIKQTLQTCLFL